MGYTLCHIVVHTIGEKKKFMILFFAFVASNKAYESTQKFKNELEQGF